MTACTRSAVAMLTDFFASDDIEAAARRTGFVKRSCTPTLRLIPLPPKPGKMPPSQDMLEGVTPWSHTFFTIDLQKMNWKFRAGVHEHPGVCLKRHCGHNGPGGYTPCISEYSSVLRRSKLYTQSCNRPISKTMCGWCGGPRC